VLAVLLVASFWPRGERTCNLGPIANTCIRIRAHHSHLHSPRRLHQQCFLISRHHFALRFGAAKVKQHASNHKYRRECGRGCEDRSTAEFVARLAQALSCRRTRHSVLRTRCRICRRRLLCKALLSTIVRNAGRRTNVCV
jgi:hypothetical protein